MRDRTADLLAASEALSQLSYSPIWKSISTLKLSKPNQSVWTLIVVSSYKEVIQPQVPLGLPCYDFTPVMNHKVVSVLPERLNYPLLLQPTPMV